MIINDHNDPLTNPANGGAQRTHPEFVDSHALVDWHRLAAVQAANQLPYKKMMTFHSPTYGNQTFDQMIDGIVDFVAADAGKGYSLMVGSDSEMNTTTHFITAIVLHRHGRGAKYYWSEMVKPRYATLRERIWQEAIFSISVARSVVEELAKREVESHNIEIHVDIGEQGPTRALIQEITGYVRGNGFAVHIKPESCAASAVADRLT